MQRGQTTLRDWTNTKTAGLIVGVLTGFFWLISFFALGVRAVDIGVHDNGTRYYTGDDRPWTWFEWVIAAPAFVILTLIAIGVVVWLVYFVVYGRRKLRRLSMKNEEYQPQAVLLLIAPIAIIIALAGLALAARGFLSEHDTVGAMLSIGLGVGMVVYGVITSYSCIRFALVGERMPEEQTEEE